MNEKPSIKGKLMSRRRLLQTAVAALLAGLPACQSLGDFTVLGYSARPMYDCNIHTVFVPIFENRTFYKGLEFDLTRAVVREIEAKTPYKVVHCRDNADTELVGSILVVTKNLLNINPNNEIRQGEMTMQCNILWRDLRTGEILSMPKQRNDLITPSMPGPGTGLDQQPEGGLLPTTPGTSPVGPLVPAVTPAKTEIPVPVTSTATFIPELGQSITTAFQGNVDRMAIQIVSMMEAPW
ncbi:MAG: LPS assembly lipoprotein LptE [Gemmataceae bacterium]